MKKRLFVMVIAVLAIVSLFATCLVACDNGDNDPIPTPDENKVTVSWYRGTSLLKEEQIEKGSKIESWTPTSPDADGNEFQGWYSEGSLTDAFDFDVEITEDTQIFSKWFKDEYVEDDNQYYVIGTGSGDMKGSNWTHALKENEDEELEVKEGFESYVLKKENVADKNVYTITLKMYAGDRFQICYTGGWEGQRGIGRMEGVQYVDGVNDKDGQTYTAADKKVAQVKDAEGKVIFYGYDENNNSYDNWNAILTEGNDGIYKFTYTTYPSAPDRNVLTYELVEKISAQTQTHNMYIIGRYNGWSTPDKDEDMIHLSEAENKETWSGFITITEDMYETGKQYSELKVYNAIDNQYYTGSDYVNVDNSNDNIKLSAGTYAIRYTVEGNKVEVEECKYYVVGTFLDGEEAVNFSVKIGVTPALTIEGTTGTVQVVAVNAAANTAYNWMIEQNQPGVFGFQVVYGSSLGIKDWCGSNNGGNFYVQAGTYNVSYDITTGAVTVVAA